MQEPGAVRACYRPEGRFMCMGRVTKPLKRRLNWYVLAHALVFSSITLVQSNAWAFDKPENWIPPVLVTYQFAIGEPIGVVAGDFNADGIPDLVVITDVNPPTYFEPPSADYAVKFYLLYGTEDSWGEPILIGTFPAPERYLFSGAITSGLDLDGDGNQEVVAVLTLASGSPAALTNLENLETRLIILWGESHGRFTMVNMRADVGLIPPTSIVHGDFNGDGLVDLAYNDPQNLAIRILYNRGERRLSDPHLVKVVPERAAEDDCILLPMSIAVGGLDPSRRGDDIAVLGPCVLDQDNYKQALRFLFSWEEDRWELSPLVPTGPVRKSFTDGLGDLMISDFDADGCIDALFTQKVFFPVAEGNPPLPTFMTIYLMPCAGRGKSDALVYVGTITWGALLFVERDRNTGWKVVAWSPEVNAVTVAHIDVRDGSITSTAIPVRGYGIGGPLVQQGGGLVVQRGDTQEIVVVSSLDLRSGITLLSVIRRQP